jgi:hypothetical protein
MSNPIFHTNILQKSYKAYVTGLVCIGSTIVKKKRNNKSNTKNYIFFLRTIILQC